MFVEGSTPIISIGESFPLFGGRPDFYTSSFLLLPQGENLDQKMGPSIPLHTFADKFWLNRKRKLVETRQIGITSLKSDLMAAKVVSGVYSGALGSVYELHPETAVLLTHLRLMVEIPYLERALLSRVWTDGITWKGQLVFNLFDCPVASPVPSYYDELQISSGAKMEIPALIKLDPGSLNRQVSGENLDRRGLLITSDNANVLREIQGRFVYSPLSAVK